MMTEYRAPEFDGEINFINIDDLAQKAKNVMPVGGWGYLSGGAGDEWTLQQNTEAFNYREIYPRVLAGIEKPDLRTSILGIDIKSPIIMAPAAAHGLENSEAEKATAKGVAEAGTIMAISTYSNATIEDIATAGGGAPQWYQLYLSKDEGFNKYVLDQAMAHQMKAIILTADATVGGNREADLRNQFAMPFPMANLEKYGEGEGMTIKQIFANAKQKIGLEDVQKVAEYTKLPVIVKGVQSGEDAMLSIGAGASAIYVSNHGGRQLDGGPASIEVLNEVAEAVDKKVPIIFDSGIRRGQHILKALASGADVVAIGRPALYGLAVGGATGVRQVFDFFNKELMTVMQLAGAQNIAESKHVLLRYN